MFLKFFLFTIAVKCLVVASQEEPNANQINDLSIDDYVDSPIVSDLETLFVDNSTETTLNETEISGNITQNLTEATTVLDNNYSDNDNNSYNVTDSTGTEGENTLAANVTEGVIVSEATIPTATVLPTNETEVTSVVPIPSTTVRPITEEEATSQEPETVIPSTTVSPTSETTISSTTGLPDSETEAKSEETETTIPSTTVLPSTETDVTPQEPDTTIDPKYRNDTFELHFEEFMRNNPSAVRITSPGFRWGTPYGNNLNETFSVTLTNCTGIDVVIHYLNLNPFVPDTLSIRGGNENATHEIGRQFTGLQFNIAYTIIHTTSLFISFKTGPLLNEEYQGFILTYAPYGDVTDKTTTTEAPVTIPQTEVQNFEVLLVLPAENRTNATWQNFKHLLSNSATKYVIEQNVHVETAHPDNVTISVFECPNNWPNYKTCIRLQFSISLWDLDYDPEVDFDLSIFDYELSTISLSVMWDLYGKYDFLEVLGIEEYSPPDGTYILLLWTGVSLSIVVIFIGVLYGIWRIDVFKEYRRMYTKNDDQQDILKAKSELDVSMYPTPHQPYPTLFETNEMNSAGYYDSNEINSSAFHNFNLDMQQEKSSTPSNYRQATSHFSPNLMDLNDSPFFTLDDEDDVKTVPTLSPRSKQRLLVLGAKRDESTT